MAVPRRISFARYLAAKKTVDDRALNRLVWQALAEAVAGRPHLRAVEAGAGIGTMIERGLAWGLLTDASYTALDALPANLRAARRRVPAWARRHGYAVSAAGQDTFTLVRPGHAVSVELQAVDVFEFARPQAGRRTWDLLLAHAFLDLVDIPVALPRLLSLLPRGGLAYLTLNFDGATLLEPTIDSALDAEIERLYHQTMDERRTGGGASGDSRAGRHLFDLLPVAGADILEAGASDWVVFPRRGSYRDDEPVFLHAILDTLDRALRGHPALARERLRAWVAARHAQVERGELTYIAHQVDLLAKRR